MRSRIKKRFVLIAAISIAQLACLSCGVLVFDHWLQGSVRKTMTKQVLDDNIETARQMTRLIEEIQLTDVDRNLQSWNRLQSIIRDIRLPNEGFVCVVRNDGQLLCHPMLNSHPLLSSRPAQQDHSTAASKQAMLKKEMPKKEMHAAGDVGEMAKIDAATMKHAARPNRKSMPSSKQPMLKAEPSEVSGGTINVRGEVEIVAAATIAALESKVLVHQRASGIEAAISRISVPVRTMGLSVAVALALLSLIVNTGILRSYENKLATLNDNLEQLNEGLEELVQERTRSLMNTRNAVIFGLAKLAESRDTDTGEHLDRIRLYVVELAEQLSQSSDVISPSYIDTLGLASSLHDIGKVGIPDQVLLKPGRLDPAEREVIERHPLIGGDCLRAISDKLGADDFLEMSREIAFGHHERWDGQGYPFNVAGEEIPLSARIVALADVYDALRSKRPYKDPMSHAKARAIILEGRGSHFDPQVVDAFLACEDKFQSISESHQDSTPNDDRPSKVMELTEQDAEPVVTA